MAVAAVIVLFAPTHQCALHAKTDFTSQTAPATPATSQTALLAATHPHAPIASNPTTISTAPASPAKNTASMAQIL